MTGGTRTFGSVSTFEQVGQAPEVLLPSCQSLRESRGRGEAFRACAELVNRFLFVLAT
jgi:hypothetical protein